MTLHLKAPTEVVIFLVGIRDERGVLRFPSKNSFNPGIVFKANENHPINEQLITETANATGLEGLNVKLEIEQNFSAEVLLPNNDKATLYVGAIYKPEGGIDETWRPLPHILRDMPKNKNRASYLRAWQVLMGGLTQDTKVLESDDAQKALQNHYDSEKPLH